MKFDFIDNKSGSFLQCQTPCQTIQIFQNLIEIEISSCPSEYNYSVKKNFRSLEGLQIIINLQTSFRMQDYLGYAKGYIIADGYTFNIKEGSFFFYCIKCFSFIFLHYRK